MASIKPSYNTNRMLLGEQLPLDTPLSVILDASEQCNFRCCYCFRSGQKDENWSFAASGGIMSLDTFNLAVMQLTEFSQMIKVVSLSGHGEPLCNPKLADMARILKGANVTERIEMHTNASLLTEDNVEDIANSGLSRIVVSLQGLTASAYERVSGVKIDWVQFYRNLKLLYESKNESLKIHIKITNLALDKTDCLNDEQKFRTVFGDIADSVFVENAVPLWQSINIEANVKGNKFGNDFGDVNYCPLVFYKILIAPDGGIYPCTNLPPPMSLGNIRDVTLLDAWNSRKRHELLKDHLRLTRHRHTPCINCYVPTNTVVSHEDIIDVYKETILKRLEALEQDE